MKSYLVLLLLGIAGLSCALTTSAQVTFSETFDGIAFPPAGWTRASSNALYQWDRATEGVNRGATPYAGAGMLMFNSYDAPSGSTADIISPRIDLSARGSSTVTLGFWIFRASIQGSGIIQQALDLALYNDEVRVYVNTSPSVSGGTLLATIPRKAIIPMSSDYRVSGTVLSTTQAWYEYVLGIPAQYNTANNYIIIRGVSDKGYSQYVDEVRWQITPPTAPIINVISSLNTFYSSPSIPSNEQSYAVGATGLTNDLVVTPSAGFEISQTPGSGFSTSPIVFTPSFGVVYYKYIYVRSSSASATTFTGTIVNSSTGASTVNVAVDGNNTVDCSIVNEFRPGGAVIPAGGGVYYWNVPANWSKGHVPTPCESVRITYTKTTSGNGTAMLNMDGAVEVMNLTLEGVYGSTSSKRLQLLQIGAYPITISGNLIISSTGGSGSNEVVFSPSGICTIEGTASVGQTSETKNSCFVGDATSPPTVTFKGNVTFGAKGRTETTATAGTYYFEKGGSQTLGASDVNVKFEEVVIGSTIPTILTVSGAPTASRLTVKSGSELVLPAGTSFNSTGTGMFFLESNAWLRLGAEIQTNFPSGFTVSLDENSSVDYNNIGGNQTISPVSYGNILLSNAGTKTTGGNLTVRGNWTNNSIFGAGTSSVTFSGNQNASIGGTSSTGFYDLVLNKGNSIATTLDVNSPISMSRPSVNTSFVNGLLRINTGGGFTKNTTSGGITIQQTSGIRLNGGSFLLGNGSLENNGLFQVSNGTATIGTASGNGLLTQNNGTVSISGGTVSVASKIEQNTGTFTMSGGVVTLNTVENTSSSRASFSALAAANVSISGGQIILQKMSTASATPMDVRIEAGGTKSISGGELIFGNANTPTNSVFRATVGTGITLSGLGINVSTGGGRLLLNTPISMNGQLTLTSGFVETTAANLLTLGTTATVSGGSNNSFVNGPIAKAFGTASEFVFPTGDIDAPAAKRYRPTGVVPTSTGSTFRAEYIYAPHAQRNEQLSVGLFGISAVEYWNVQRTSGASSARVRLDYQNPDNWVMHGGDPIVPCTACNIAVVGYNNATANNWAFTGSTFSSSVPEYRYYNDYQPIYSSVINTFGDFTFGIGYNSVLPISVRLTTNGNTLLWNTDSASYTYEVQYASDGRNFRTVATGNGTEHVELGGFYRIKVTNRAGTSSYSNIVNVAEINSPLVVYPNPTRNRVWVKGYNGTTPIEVFDVSSKKLFETKSASIDLGIYPSGLYLIKIGIHYFKIQKQ